MEGISPGRSTRKPDIPEADFCPEKILVPVDGSPNSFRALEVAAKIASKFHAEMRVLYVLQQASALLYAISAPGTPTIITDEYYTSAEEEASGFLSKMMTIARNNEVHCTEEIIRTASSIVNTIVTNSKADNVDLIVIGTRGLGGFRRMLLGSVSSGVVAHASCSVLVVR